MKANQITKRLVEVFACEDGGVELCYFRLGLEQLEKQSNDGDVSAAQLIRIAAQFISLVDGLTEKL